MGTHSVKLRTAFALAGFCAVGALAAGCPTVDLGDTPVGIGSCLPDREYFDTVIWPMYIANPDASKSCVSMSGCHNDQMSARSGMHLQVDPLDLSANYRTVSRHLNCADPGASDMVTYPTELLPHPVGLFTPTDPEVVSIFLPWFDQ
jgi:hypothetical protein